MIVYIIHYLFLFHFEACLINIVKCGCCSWARITTHTTSVNWHLIIIVKGSRHLPHAGSFTISLNESKYSWNSTIRNPSIYRILSSSFWLFLWQFILQLIRSVSYFSLFVQCSDICVFHIVLVDKKAITAFVVMFTSTWIQP